MSRLIRIPAVRHLLGDISTPTLWRLRVSDPSFPLPIKVTGSTLAFYEDEILAWLKGRRANTVRVRFEEEEMPILGVPTQPCDPDLLARLRALHALYLQRRERQ